MKEIFGELWSYFAKPSTTVLITTNGTITKDGKCVMGRGCAAQAKVRFPGIDAELGRRIAANGNVMLPLEAGLIYSFPTKHNWYEKADLTLIAQSARQLANLAVFDRPSGIYILPRPGCNNGRLRWEEVKPVIAFLPDNVWVITNG